MNEEWKPIENYEDLYWVSNFGNVKSKRKNKKLSINLDGYYVVNLSKNGKSKIFNVHRLVAKAFISNPNNLPQVNHKDENKLNNNVDNLEWCDSNYNHNYGTRNKRTGLTQRNNSRSKIVLQSDLQGNFIKEWPSLSEIVRQLSTVRHSNLSACCNGR
jgi:hypothetical protein